MKKFKLLALFSSLVIVAAIIISGCTKEGPAGPAGANGKDGKDGTNGQDGTAGCVQCHNNSQIIMTKVIQWEHSVHATGGNFERNGTSCAPCHTSQGFLEVVASGGQTTAEAIENPAPQNCFTCHNIHATYTPADWALTYTDALPLWLNGAVYDYGKSNLCAHCHQPRPVDPFPVVGGTNTYDMTNKRYGPHHGPQSAMLMGTGGYEVGTGYSNTMHTTLVTDGCVTCHMASAFGDQAGGHTWNMEYEYHGSTELNDAGCIACHDDAAADLEEAHTEINDLLAQLKQVLIDNGILNESDYLVVPATYTDDQLGAVLNYQFVREDRSGGAHNKKYAKALLENSIALFN